MIGDSEDRMISTRLNNISKLITSIPANMSISLLTSCCHYYQAEFEKTFHLPKPLHEVVEANAGKETSFFVCLAIQLTKLFPALQKSKDANVIFFNLRA